MSIKVRLKHSSTLNKAPLPADLDSGELALNINDNSPAAYIKDSAGNIVKLAGVGAEGTYWSRTGTDLSPTTNGDSVQLKDGTGTVSVDLDAGTPTVPLVRKSSGHLGVGTFSPRFVSDVTGTASGPAQIVAGFSSTSATIGDGTAIGFTNEGGQGITGRHKVGIGSIRTGTFDRSALCFYTNDTGSAGDFTASDERARFTSSGDFLLGGTLPASQNIKLSANGQIDAVRYIAKDAAGNLALRVVNQTTTKQTFGVAGDGKLSIGSDISAAGTTNVTINADGSATFAGEIGIGGTLPASPNIKLQSAGLGTFNRTNGEALIANRNGGAGSGVLIQLNGAEKGWLGTNSVNGLMLQSSGTLHCQAGGTGGVQLTGSATSWSPLTSESRLKDFQSDPDVDQCWDLVRDIQLKRYYYKDQEDKTGVSYMGPMADWLGVQDPELLIDTGRSDDDGPIHTYNQGLLDMKALAALSAALKRIEQLEAKVTALEGGAPIIAGDDEAPFAKGSVKRRR